MNKLDKIFADYCSGTITRQQLKTELKQLSIKIAALFFTVNMVVYLIFSSIFSSKYFETFTGIIKVVLSSAISALVPAVIVGVAFYFIQLFIGKKLKE